MSQKRSKNIPLYIDNYITPLDSGGCSIGSQVTRPVLQQEFGEVGQLVD